MDVPDRKTDDVSICVFDGGTNCITDTTDEYEHDDGGPNLHAGNFA